MMRLKPFVKSFVLVMANPPDASAVISNPCCA